MLQQKYKFQKRTYSLDRNGVNVEHKSLFNHSSFFIHYDKIPARTEYKTAYSKGWLWAAVIATMLAISMSADYMISSEKNDAILFYAIAAGVSWACFWLTFHKFVGYRCVDNGHLLIYTDTPSRESVEAFLNEVQAKKLEFYKNRIQHHIEQDLDLENQNIIPGILQYIHNLRDSDMITEDGYTQLRKVVDVHVENIKKHRSVGFAFD